MIGFDHPAFRIQFALSSQWINLIGITRIRSFAQCGHFKGFRIMKLLTTATVILRMRVNLREPSLIVHVHRTQSFRPWKSTTADT
jgi:hypothetical protein